MQENRRQVLKKRAAEVSASKNDEEINWDDVADLAEPSDIPTEMQDKLLNEYEKELKGQKSLKKELNIKENKITPDKGSLVNWIREFFENFVKSFFSFSEENSSDDWEKLSSGSKSPRKQSKDGEVSWFHEFFFFFLSCILTIFCRMRIGCKPKF